MSRPAGRPAEARPSSDVPPAKSIFHPAQNGRRLVTRLFWGYLLLIALAFFLLRSPAVMQGGSRLNADRALFTALNAATLTGFQQTVGIEQFNPDSRMGVAAVLILTIGGILFFLSAGGMAAIRALRLPYADRDVVRAAAGLVAAATPCAAFFLHGANRDVGDSLLQAAGALGNSAMSSGRPAGLWDWQTHVIILPLAALGGLGLPVLMELLDRLGTGRRLSRHSQTVLALTAGLYLFGFLGLLLVQWPDAGSSWAPAVVVSSAESLNARTLGLPLQPVSALPRIGQWLIVLLMMIGASPAGTGGGLKTTTLLQIGAGVRRALAGRPVPRIFGIAAVWLAIYFLIVITGFALLLWLEPQLAADRVFFICVSAASNVGLSQDPISTVGPGLYVLSGMMLAGRIAPLLVLWSNVEADLLVG